ncbi:hypothetical protein ElyMa_003227500 [Elysia marginata]|uniref:Nuclear receptor domain-containing protein n=1 Tax=Elysia marginata TaxID=1093978 RepID=A0AAV4J7M9_9GAST|nr:hypothetical protein ElyMa_003227500 [Elysia marginata]
MENFNATEKWRKEWENNIPTEIDSNWQASEDESSHEESEMEEGESSHEEYEMEEDDSSHEEYKMEEGDSSHEEYEMEDNPDPEEKTDTCRVCGAGSQCVNYGVLTCNACRVSDTDKARCVL